MQRHDQLSPSHGLRMWLAPSLPWNSFCSEAYKTAAANVSPIKYYNCLDVHWQSALVIVVKILMKFESLVRPIVAGAIIACIALSPSITRAQNIPPGFTVTQYSSDL